MFLIGDKVKFKNTSHDQKYASYHFGGKPEDTYTVEGESVMGNLLLVNDRNGSENNANPNRLEKVSVSKFKVGDKVRVTKVTYGQIKVGMVGEVIHIHDYQNRVLVKFPGWDKGHYGTLSGGSEMSKNPDCWNFAPNGDDGEIELVETAAGVSPKFILITEENGKLAPALTPKVYATQAQAEKVAQEMAKKHGGKFYVFATTALVEAPKVDYTVKRIAV